MANQEDQNPNAQTAQKTDGKKSKKMKTSSTKGDAIDKGKTLTGSRPDAINMNPVYTHVNNSFETSFGDELNELNVQQRMKKGLNFRRIQSKVQLAKKRAMLRKGSGKVIAKRAKVLAINILKSKLAGNRKVSDLSPMEKQRVEKILGRGSARVNRLALRMIPTVKKKEAKRFLKKESIDLDNLAEAVAFINEAVNCAAGGGVRGMGHATGNPDGEPSNYVSANIADFDKRNDEMLDQKKEFHDKLHTKKVTKEDYNDDPYLRLDGKGSTVMVYKNHTPGEPKSTPDQIRKAGPKLQKMPKVQEAETREAIPRSGQPRKSIQNVVRDSVCRCMSTGPYRQQSIQKKVIDEQLSILESTVSSIDRGEYDYEGAMARTQLQTICRNARELVDMLKDNENMPEWVQSKITLAQDYIACVNDYLQSRKELGESSYMNEDLRKWFSKTDPEGGWKRINSKGEAIGPCAREEGEPKPKCMSNEKRAALTKKERASAVRAKRKHDPNPERKGDPINVSNFGKGKISEACWTGFKKIGMKKKGDRMVPDCVPEAANAAQQAAIAISMKKKGIKPKNEEVEYIDEKNSPTNPALWSKAKALARSKFDVYPSAYANGWAAKWYKSKGGGWKSLKEESIDEAFEQLDEVAAWQRKEGKRESGGLNQKGVDSYRREHPGSKLKTAVTTKPSKLKPGSKAAKRRKSFCARMSGMKKRLTSAKTANDPDSRINKSLRKWNC